MSSGGASGGSKTPREYEVTETAPNARDVVDAEPDDDAEIQRRRDAALASTYDPALAHSGKTGEELIEERQDEARMLSDVAIVTAAAIAAHEIAEGQADDSAGSDFDGEAEAGEDDGGDASD